MPKWLAAHNSLCVTRPATCEPSNYDTWGRLVLAYLDEVGCDEHPGTCEVEVWNEPYLHEFFLSDASCQQRTEAYKRLYVNTHAAIKARYPDMAVSGPSGYIGSICSKEFLTEFLRAIPASQVDFVTIHTYADAKLSEQITDSMNLIRANGHGKNVKITELGAASALVDTGPAQTHEFVLSSAFVIAASREPTLTTIAQFQWADDNKYADGLPHYNIWPSRRELFSEPLLDNANYAGFTVSEQLGTLHPEGSMVVKVTAPDNILTLATDGTNGRFVTIVNRHRLSAKRLTVKLFGVDAVTVYDVDTGVSYPVIAGVTTVGNVPAKTARHFQIISRTT